MEILGEGDLNLEVESKGLAPANFVMEDGLKYSILLCTEKRGL